MSDNNITIEIDGQNFSNFLSGNVTRRFDEFCGTFSLKCTKDDVNAFNIDSNSNCVIYINDKKVLTGVVDDISPSEDPSSSTVDISGRDITCDIVDSELPTSISLSGSFNLVTVTEQVLKSLGLDENIKVINKIADLKNFTQADIVANEVDKNAFEFLNDYSQKASAILITNADGNIEITRAGSDILPDKILNQYGNKDNNVLSSSAGYDFSQRYYKYIVVSQNNSNTTEGQITAENVSQKGIAYDEEVRQTRVKVIKSQNACDSATCQEIATLQCNVRRANSLKYTCKLAGYELNSGDLYSINKLMTVIDDDNFIESQLLVKSVSFNFGDGAETDLEFGYLDSYTLQANLEDIDKRANKTDTRTNKKNATNKKKTSTKKAKTAKKDTKIILNAQQQAELNKALGI